MNTTIRLSLAALFFSSLITFAAEKVDLSKLPAPSDKTIDFVKDLKPVLEKSCFGCHGAKPRAKAKYFMNDRQKSIAGGSSRKGYPGKADQPFLPYCRFGGRNGNAPLDKGTATQN